MIYTPPFINDSLFFPFDPYCNATPGYYRPGDLNPLNWLPWHVRVRQGTIIRIIEALNSPDSMIVECLSADYKYFPSQGVKDQHTFLYDCASAPAFTHFYMSKDDFAKNLKILYGHVKAKIEMDKRK
jgi:hypothetical protein